MAKGKIKTSHRTGFEIRYYTKGEWYKLSIDEQNGCREILQASLQQKRKTDDDNNTSSAKNAALETKISEMKEQIVAASSSRNANITPPNGSKVSLGASLVCAFLELLLEVVGVPTTLDFVPVLLVTMDPPCLGLVVTVFFFTEDFLLLLLSLHRHKRRRRVSYLLLCYPFCSSLSFL